MFRSLPSVWMKHLFLQCLVTLVPMFGSFISSSRVWFHWLQLSLVASTVFGSFRSCSVWIQHWFLQSVVPSLVPTKFGSIGYLRPWFHWFLCLDPFISSHRFWSQWLLQSLAPVLVPAEFGSLIRSYSVCFHCLLQSLGSLVTAELNSCIGFY